MSDLEQHFSGLVVMGKHERDTVSPLNTSGGLSNDCIALHQKELNKSRH